MLVQEDSSYNIPKLEKIIIKIVPVLWIYTKFVNPTQEFSIQKWCPEKWHITCSPIWKCTPGYSGYKKLTFAVLSLKMTGTATYFLQTSTVPICSILPTASLLYYRFLLLFQKPSGILLGAFFWQETNESIWVKTLPKLFKKFHGES